MSAINEVDDQNLIEDNEGKEGKEEMSSNKIKIFYIITVGLILLIVALVAVIVIVMGGDSNDTDNENNQDDLIDPNMNENFTAIYETTQEGQEVKLFNKNLIENIQVMSVDNETIEITNKYKFNQTGEHIVKIQLKKELESTNEMFKDCINLVQIIFKNFKTQNIQNMGGMFQGCSSLKELNLNSFNTKKVKKK